MKNNSNKRAKRTTLTGRPRTVIVTNYTCPSCHTVFEEHGLPTHVLRVKCTHCQQEIILRD